MQPIEDGLDARQRTALQPGAGVADAGQGPAGLILTAGARVTLDQMLHLRLSGFHRRVLGGKTRACARAHHE